MLDSERIRKDMIRIDEYRKRIEKVVPNSYSAYSKADFMLKNAIERNLQLISDLQLDILLRLYKDLESKLSGDEQSLLEGLRGHLNNRVIERVKERRALRNMLVHAYSDTEYDEIVFKQARNPDDLDEFSRAVKGLIR